MIECYVAYGTKLLVGPTTLPGPLPWLLGWAQLWTENNPASIMTYKTQPFVKWEQQVYIRESRNRVQYR